MAGYVSSRVGVATVPVLPNLQQCVSHDDEDAGPGWIDGLDCRFKALSPSQAQEVLSQNLERQKSAGIAGASLDQRPLGALMLGYLRWFGWLLDNAHRWWARLCNCFVL